jgi:DHA1 family multidrug resistance protein-like MFS transporter
MKNMNKSIAVLFVTLVIVMMGFGMIIPIMPFLVEEFGASGSAIGFLMSIFALMQLIFSPIWGTLSDRYGRRPILLIGILGNSLAMIFMGVSTELWMLFAARALAGMLSSATLPTAMAIIGDSTSNEDRGRGMGILGAAMGVGMVIGPGVSGWLVEQFEVWGMAGTFSPAVNAYMIERNLFIPFFLSAVLSVISLVVVFFSLPESLPQEKRTNTTIINISGQFSEMWKAMFGPIGFLLFLAFLVSFGLTSFESVFSLFAEHRHHYGPREVGTLLTMVGLISAIAQGGLIGPLTKRFGEEIIIKASLLLSAGGFILMLLAFDDLTFYLFTGFFVLSNAMIRPGVSSLTSKRAVTGQGSAMGLNNSFMSLGRVVGPTSAGLLFDMNITYPYIMGSAITLIGFALCLFLLNVVKPTKQQAPGTTPAS